MQKISLALNIILLLAVGYLFGQHLKGEGNESNEEIIESPKSEAGIISGDAQRIAFVNVDSLDLNYQYIVDSYEDLEKEQKRSRKRLDQKLRDAESRYAELQKESVYMTQKQLQAAEVELQELTVNMQKLEQELTVKIQNMQNKANKTYKEKLVSFLDEYSEGKDYDCVLGVSSIGSVLWSKDAFDITNEVLDKLNSDYQASLQAEEEK